MSGKFLAEWCSIINKNAHPFGGALNDGNLFILSLMNTIDDNEETFLNVHRNLRINFHIYL